MLTIGMKNKCMDEIIQVISKYTQDVSEAKKIIDYLNIDEYSKLVVKETTDKKAWILLVMVIDNWHLSKWL